MGGLDMESHEDENVRLLFTFDCLGANDSFNQGLEGPITFSGFTPELDEFVIRIVDGSYILSPLNSRKLMPRTRTGECLYRGWPARQ
jgi:hypothetical protein